MLERMLRNFRETQQNETQKNLVFLTKWQKDALVQFKASHNLQELEIYLMSQQVSLTQSVLDYFMNTFDRPGYRRGSFSFFFFFFRDKEENRWLLEEIA